MAVGRLSPVGKIAHDCTRAAFFRTRATHACALTPCACPSPSPRAHPPERARPSQAPPSTELRPVGGIVQPPPGHGVNPAPEDDFDRVVRVTNPSGEPLSAGSREGAVKGGSLDPRPSQDRSPSGRAPRETSSRTLSLEFALAAQTRAGGTFGGEVACGETDSRMSRPLQAEQRGHPSCCPH